MDIQALLKACVVASTFAVFGGAASAQDMPKVSIGISSGSLSGATSRICQEMGLFKKHGLDATVITLDNTSMAATSLISGSINFASASPSEVILAQARGIDMVALRSLRKGISGVVVLAKPVADKLGVSPTAPLNERLKALDGLVIATPSPSSPFTLALKPSAEAAGAKIRFTHMDQQAMVAGLESGRIQGIMASFPYYSSPLLSGTGVMWVSGPKGEFPAEYSPVNALTLNAMRPYAQANPEILRRMNAVLDEFELAIKERPDVVKAAIMKVYPNVDPKTISFLFDTEASGFLAKPLTADDMVREVAFIKSSGVNIPGIDNAKPAAYLFP